ncbi:MAG: exodeoxyribonuclease VII small subunit [Alphaproteobacteria bacterium]|nr:MAG: exodeoxyribonuclease VII small subunit [Alphaproteobacteria bacterium]
MSGEANTIPDNIAGMNFEDALSALEEIVKNLESGQVSLEQSIDIYTRGTQLRQHCDNKLKDATARIEKITKAQDGTLAITDLDAG